MHTPPWGLVLSLVRKGQATLDLTCDCTSKKLDAACEPTLSYALLCLDILSTFPAFCFRRSKKMSDATRGDGDDGQPRFRRSWFEHAGEVTKKEKPADEANAPPTEEPPRPTGPKIGGARDFRQTKAPLDAASNETGASHSGLLTTGGVQASVHRVNTEIGSTNGRSLDAQPGWRRYWSNVTSDQLYEWKGLPEVKVSDFCYECHERLESCYGRQAEDCRFLKNDSAVACGRCVRYGSKCLFMISYCYHPDEDWDIGKVSDYSMREHARNWQAAQRAPLTVATRTKPSTPLPLASLRPKAPKNDIEESKPTAVSQRIPLAQQRATYEGLAEMYTKDSYHEDTGKNLRSMPYWEGSVSAPAPPTQICERPRRTDLSTLVKSFDLGGSSTVKADEQEISEQKRSTWQHGRVERWVDAQLTTSLYARVPTII
jgi:hypothetical protein